jgi:hypothetical protein
MTIFGFNPYLFFGGVLVAIFLVFTFLWFYYEATAPATCSLQKRKLIKDKCIGSCPPGETCINTGDRPYGPWGLLGTQPAICNCAPNAWAASLDN